MERLSIKSVRDPSVDEVPYIVIDEFQGDTLPHQSDDEKYKFGLYMYLGGEVCELGEETVYHKGTGDGQLNMTDADIYGKITMEQYLRLAYILRQQHMTFNKKRGIMLNQNQNIMLEEDFIEFNDYDDEYQPPPF